MDLSVKDFLPFVPFLGSLLGGFLGAWFVARKDKRDAWRNILKEDIKEVGVTIYGAVATAKILYERRKTGESFKQWIEKASKNNKRLESVRKKVRYSLYGMDDAFRTLIRLKEYVNHTFHDVQTCEYILSNADRLREIMDDIILSSFRDGRIPSEKKLLMLRRCISDIDNKYRGFMENKNLSEK